MIEQLSRSYLAEVTESLPAERAIVAKIGTGDLDRFMTVIDPAGMDLKAFRENPVCLWEHGKDPTRGRLPIGRNVWIKARKSGNGELLAKTQFAKDDYSQSLYEMYRDGYLSGWSIHALPDERQCSPPTKEERRARPELERCQMMYRGTELTEYSGTAVPGNARALTMLQERGIWVPDEARTSPEMEEPDADDAGGPSDGDADDLTDDERKRIRRDGDGYMVSDDDGAETRYATLGEARECLAQMGRPRGLVVDVAAVHRHYLGLIEAHYGRCLEHVQAQMDLMRGRV